jgi:hypothetical protein
LGDEKSLVGWLRRSIELILHQCQSAGYLFQAVKVEPVLNNGGYFVQADQVGRCADQTQ